MPVSPDLARGLAKRTLEIYLRAEAILLEQVAARVVETFTGDLKLTTVQRLRAALERIVAELDMSGSQAAAEAVAAAYMRGVETASTELSAAGIHVAVSGVNTRSIEILVQGARRRVVETNLPIKRTVLDTFRVLHEEASAQVLLGSQSRREASARSFSQLARAGITFRDKLGREWEMGAYAEMSVRTQAAQVMVQGHVDRLAEQGLELVIVSNAPEECKLCRPWEGKVLAIRGGGARTIQVEHGTRDGEFIAVAVAGSLAEAVRAGLQHPNCRHSVSLYQPGVTKAPTRTADPAGDKLRQRQRLLERNVRSAKRQVAAMEALKKAAAGNRRLTPTDPVMVEWRKAREGLSRATGEHDRFVEANDRKRLAYRLNTITR